MNDGIYRSAGVVACIAFVCAMTADIALAQTRNDIIFVSNFDSNGFQPVDDSVDGWSVVAVDPGHAQITGNARETANGVRLFLDKGLDYSSVNGNGSDKPRVNLSKYKLKFDYETDYWLGWSVYLPNSWKDDLDSNWTTIMQLKQPVGGSPILSLNVKGDSWEFINRRDETNVTYSDSSTDVSVLYTDSTARDKGRWVDFVVHFRLCESANCDGKLTIWKDRERIVNMRGPNAYVRVSEGPFLTLNLYKSGWKKKDSLVDTRELYFDAVRIGGPGSDFDSVSPSTSFVETEGAVRPNPPTLSSAKSF